MKAAVLATMVLAGLVACGRPNGSPNAPSGKSLGADTDSNTNGEPDPTAGGDPASVTDEEPPERPTDDPEDTSTGGGFSCANFLGIGDGCDCGCGVDPDCGGSGCSEPGCYAATCDYCFGPSGTLTGCAPEGWTCSKYGYADGWACDCGCGIPDPDCDGGGCVDAECDVPGVCEACHANGTAITCESMRPPREWTCAEYYYADGYACNCGCGAPDPDCERGGCAEAGCDDAACTYCADASGAFITCPSRLPPEGWLCSEYDYADSFCDCGCGVRDRACANDETCDENGCSPTCDFCMGEDGQLHRCNEVND